MRLKKRCLINCQKNGYKIKYFENRLEISQENK